MNTINNITDYIITCIKGEDNKASLSNLKLQKLLYYVQAWSLGINGEVMFDDDFEAWVHGPVNRSIFERFQDTKILYSEIDLEDRINPNVELTEDDEEFVEYILENYGGMSGAALERLTHQEKPWLEARGDLPRYERCTNLISRKTMKEYYGKRWEELQEN